MSRLQPNHPFVQLDNGREIIVCANCERVRTVIMLTGDRWLCTACRTEGRNLVRIPVTQPRRNQ